MRPKKAGCAFGRRPGQAEASNANDQTYVPGLAPPEDTSWKAACTKFRTHALNQSTGHSAEGPHGEPDQRQLRPSSRVSSRVVRPVNVGIPCSVDNARRHLRRTDMQNAKCD